MSEEVVTKTEAPMDVFRRSVGFQFMFVLHSGLDIDTAIDHICKAAERFKEASNALESVTIQEQKRSGIDGT